MPILMLGVMALLVFVAMGFMLFSAMMAERRDRGSRAAAAAAPVPQEAERPKSRAAHA